jgi:hypothetical protein
MAKTRRSWNRFLVPSVAIVIILGFLQWYYWPRPWRNDGILRGFPEAGYYMLTVPSADGGPGTLQGRNKRNEYWPVARSRLRSNRQSSPFLSWRTRRMGNSRLATC